MIFLFVLIACRTSNCRTDKNIFFVPPVQLPFVKAQGKTMVTDNGETVFLRGINFGAWLFWDGGAYSLPCVTEHEFRQGLEAQLPLQPELVDGFFNGIKENYIREGDFSGLASMGINYIRLCFHYRYVNETSLTELDTAVQRAKQNNIYIMLNMHVAPGGQNAAYYADTDGQAHLWDTASNQDELVHAWEILSERYKNEPAVLGYELINEPQAPDSAQLVSLYQRVIAAIRARDIAHLVFLDGNNYARDFTGMVPADLGENIAYVFHSYDTISELPGVVLQYRNFQDLHQVPILCNEYGGTDREALTAYFESEGISHAPWGYKLAFDTTDTAQFYYMPASTEWKTQFLVPYYTYFLTHNDTMQTDVTAAINAATIPSDCKTALINKLADPPAGSGFLSPNDFVAAAKIYPSYASALSSLYQQVDNIQIPYMAEGAAVVLQGLGISGLSAVTNSLRTEFWARGEADWIQ
jgi:hypothetical protein